MNLNFITLSKMLILSVLLIDGSCKFKASEKSGKVYPRLDKVEEIGKLEFPQTIIARDGGYSTMFNGESVWVFGDTLLNRPGEDGSAWRSSTWSGTMDLNAGDNIGPFIEPMDSFGVPEEFLQFTKKEQAFNYTHSRDNCVKDCEARYALWPGPIILNPVNERSLVFYTKIIARPGYYNFKSIGVSIAEWDGQFASPVRPNVREGTLEPTLLFNSKEPALASSALVINNYLYVYGCKVGYLRAPCIIARVPLEKIFLRESWSFFNEKNLWVAEYKNAKKILSGAPIMTVHWNNYLNKYIAIHNAIVSNTIMIHTSGKPEGPWTKAKELFTGLAPHNPEVWNYSAVAHKEFSKNNGQVEFITYFRPTKTGGEMRLVKLIFK